MRDAPLHLLPRRAPPDAPFVADGRTCLEARPARRGRRTALPLVGPHVAAGAPSTADDFAEGWVDLNERLVEHEGATFLVRALGTSMGRAGIASGDLLVVDRVLEPRAGDVVVAAVEGAMTVKRLRRERSRLVLTAEPEDAEEPPALPARRAREFLVWGVVTVVVKGMRRPV